MFRQLHSSTGDHPTSPFTISEPQNPYVDWRNFVVQETRVTDYKAAKLRKGSSGSRFLLLRPRSPTNTLRISKPQYFVDRRVFLEFGRVDRQFLGLKIVKESVGSLPSKWGLKGWKLGEIKGGNKNPNWWLERFNLHFCRRARKWYLLDMVIYVFHAMKQRSCLPIYLNPLLRHRCHRNNVYFF